MRKLLFSNSRRCLKYIALALLFYPLSVLGAQGHISVKGQSITIKQAIQLIEKNSEYTFFYNAADLKNTQRKNINCSGSIDQILKEVFAGSGISYIIKDKEVILKVEKTESTQQQKKKRIITGTVTASDIKEPIIGANIWLKNSSTGTITDIDGKYSINIEGIGGVLEFSYLGYKKVEVAISDNSVINVVLEPDTETLDEVVVVGYGTQKKASVIGAITNIDAAKLKVSSASVSNALAGQLAGVISMTGSGEPGRASASDFYIRGIASFTGNNTPLVLVDGVERELDLVDVDDIASFSILKDASASAVYGSRGANGVILITTKKGTTGKPVITVRTEAGITMPTRMPKMANATEWAEMLNEAKGTQYYTQEEIDKYRNGSDPDLYPNVNWIDELYKNMATNQRVTLNVSGGGDICKYYVSGGFYNEGSIFKEADNLYDYDSSIHYNKFNFRANMDFSLTPSTTFNISLANIYESYWGPGADTDNIWMYTFLTSPNSFPKEYSDGTISAPSAASGYNPWNLLAHSGYREKNWNSSQSLIGLTQDMGAIWKPLEGLTANVKFSWDASNITQQIRSKEITQYHAKGRDEDGNLIFGDPIYSGDGTLSYNRTSEGTITTYMEASLNYTRLIGEKHRIGALFLYNHKIKKDTHANNQTASLPYKNQGLAGRITYAYNDTYFAEVNVGYTGSENFAPGHRFGFFPAYSLGWMISNEKFWNPIRNVVNELKLKASYGMVGNDDIGAYKRWIYMPTIVDGGSWNYGASGNIGGTGLSIGDVENLEASWEKAYKTNIGLEMRLFDRIRIQADYFYEKREGMYLTRASLPAYVGLTTVPNVNVGKAELSGIDGNIEYEQQVGKVLLTARANATFSRNKMLNNDEPDWVYKYQNSIGKPFGRYGATQRKGLVALGLFQSQEEIDASPVQEFGEYRVGDIKYKDVNGDGVINTYDRIAIGYTDLPEMVYGFGITANWKGFDVNVLFNGVARTSLYLDGTALRPFSSSNMDRAAIYKDIYNKVWKSTNTAAQNASAIYPRLSYGAEAGSTNNGQTSTWWLRDRNFLRLKNVEIGYALPKNILNKTFIKSLRFYVSGTNLLTFSKFKLWDPELLDTSDGSKYPNNATVVIGLNANF